MNGMKAFIFDPLWDELVTNEGKKALADSNIEVSVIKEIAPISSYDALFEGAEEKVVCINPDYVKWNLMSEDYKNIPNLKAILGEATSFSWIDASYATENNVPVCNIRGFSSNAVADWAILMMFNISRRVPELIKDGFPLDFDKDYMKYRGLDLHGKTAAIVGFGRIGSAIAERCAGLGMNVAYWSANTRTEDYKFMEIADLFATADVVFPVMAINESSKAVITRSLIDSMRLTAIIVDVVENLFDVDYVLHKVADGKLFGFGFEAPPASFTKYSGNVWAAPAYAWVTDSSMSATVALSIENIVNAASGKFPNRVN